MMLFSKIKTFIEGKKVNLIQGLPERLYLANMPYHRWQIS